ncbi:MAG: bifunctional tRNA (5-methylaminomethyl-2-thiouridine)(34)-methyltransferase MnmD/FAD-dependent 5-carboxymethylaminomethyl-2-thiouridine(34) oxidoreductase MnmC [Betaproteobacteria bacterium]|nr:MAG: bifunctional tRNA (5-methylaminomethyl-2-thiouridine)(34)-methyltransferase MnmD/FAD-dependent 5-carboxymethylaminomethyl-2-thiouridine(34) oxidoreductase MnmC [Betaproteobacteria bacterium]
MPITPARLAHAADGTPYSDTFDDVYHSSDGGLGQARHVFLAGNDLPRRWAGRERFVVLETGFGLGLNFLATWDAWRRDAQRCARLHFVSFELHPFTVDDLARLHQRWPELTALATELRAAWPPLTPGVHRLHLDEERVTLTLYFGDARDGLAQLPVHADALYLDGFSPAKNPDLWSARVFHLLARCCAPGATLATWSVAGEVREGLRRAGFTVRKAPGFGGKRQMLQGLRADARDASAAPAQKAPSRHALVIGAGIAGSSVAERLAARGWTVDVIDAADAPGRGASGNHAGVLRPLPSLDDNRMGRLTRAGTLYGWRHIARLARRGLPVRAEACGVLHLARDGIQLAKMLAVVERLGLPPSHLRFVDAAEASALAGWPLQTGGWWFGDSGWVQPPSLCAANIAAHPEHIRTHFGHHVARLDHSDDAWRAVGEDGRTIAAAAVAVLATGSTIRDFSQAAVLPVVAARGQVSLLPATGGSAPRVVVCRAGYVSPEVDGVRCAGASFDVDDDEPALREADHAANLARLEAMLPGYTATLATREMRGRVGFRPASPDRMPMVGGVPLPAGHARSTPLAAIARHPGLYAMSGYGARGLVWAALMAELLASRLEGDPPPLEQDLVDAVDPARYLQRPAAAVRGEE